MMYLDDVMVRGALHARALDAFYQHLIPRFYRHVTAPLYGALHCVRQGYFVAVRSRDHFYVAQCLHDALVVRGENVPAFALAVEWAVQLPHRPRHYHARAGRDAVLSSTIFHVFLDGQLIFHPDGSFELSADTYDLMSQLTFHP